eukprot:TRINITY_DN41261_c0_g1_i1.p1 TRINITY_DN41261_c0_g1~~TRINITY_DN41261_c0_g1_i1.p1  ORF type:complete len:1003 (+),score=300.90 TRINITY_DN41261_c0_g1_i1:163-3171(+)
MDSSAGRVQVFARVRPLGEHEAGFAPAVETNESARSLCVRNENEALERILAGHSKDPAPCEVKEYVFDAAFPPDAQQRDVFTRVGLPVLREALKGINGTILAYGQTGSGKTHSLLHQSQKSEEAGLLPRLVANLFLLVSQDIASAYDIEAASVQVYNEQVDDLLHQEHQKGGGHNLNVRDGGIVPGLTWVKCSRPEQMLEAFTRARTNVVYAETKMNKASSRSHAVFQLRITKRPRACQAHDGSQKIECTIARLSVVDLAGSERVKKSGAEGMRFQEATAINKSLLAFGNVVSALAAKKAHIPLRDSKLTRILEGSIGGNCRTALLVCASPAVENVPETLNTLEFASRAMRVEVDAKVNTAVVEISAKALLEDMHGEGHDIMVKAELAKKELEALRKQSSEAAEEAKREMQREMQREVDKREHAIKEAESKALKLQQSAEDAQKREGKWQEQLDALRQDQTSARGEAQTLRKAAEKAAAEAKEAKAALEGKAQELEKLRMAMQRAEQDALEWKAAAESRAQEIKEVRVVQAKKDTADVVKRKEELVKAKEATRRATDKLEEVQKQLQEASEKLEKAEARTTHAENAAVTERERAAAAEKQVELALAEARQELSATVQAVSDEERHKAEVALQEAVSEARALQGSLQEQSAAAALLEAELEERTKELSRRSVLLDEANEALERLRQDSVEAERRLKESFDQQLEALRSSKEEEACQLRAELEDAGLQRLETAKALEEERQQKQTEIAALQTAIRQKASTWVDEKERLQTEFKEALDKQRQDFELRLNASREELETRLAHAEREAQTEREKLLQSLQEAQEHIQKSEESWREMKEQAVREAWETGTTQQRRLAAAFKAAREIEEQKASELQEAHSDLAKRFAARESRQEDLEQIGAARRKLEEANRHLSDKEREKRELALELQYRMETDRIFGSSAEKRRPRSAMRDNSRTSSARQHGMGQPVAGKKLGESQQFVERDKRRQAMHGMSVPPRGVLLGNTSQGPF